MTSEEQEEKHRKQREERGFDDSELWNLDATILEFVIPRLKAFRAMEKFGWPSGIPSEKYWHIILDRIVEGFELYLNDDYTNLKELERIQRKFDISMKLFAKWFGAMWD